MGWVLWGGPYRTGSVGCLVAPRSLAWICGAGGVQAVGFDGKDVWGPLGWICGVDLWGAHCSLLSCASVCGVHAVLTWGAELWGRALGSMGQSCGVCGAELWGLGQSSGAVMGPVGQSSGELLQSLGSVGWICGAEGAGSCGAGCGAACCGVELWGRALLLGSGLLGGGDGYLWGCLPHTWGVRWGPSPGPPCCGAEGVGMGEGGGGGGYGAGRGSMGWLWGWQWVMGLVGHRGGGSVGLVGDLWGGCGLWGQ